MEEKEIEQQLYKLRGQLYVNQTLKSELRKSFKKRSRIGWKIISMSGLAAAALIAFFIQGRFHTSGVVASSLNITDSLSFFDIAAGDIGTISHSGGKLFFSQKQTGTFVETNEGIEKVAAYEMDDLDVQDGGKKIVYSQDDSIYVFNNNTKKRELIIWDESSEYRHPVWKDTFHIFAAKAMGENKKIVEIDIKTKRERVITDGANPAYHPNSNLLVFERGKKIIVKDIKTEKERIIDTGRQPSVSKDGSYIGYVKEQDHVDNVWVTDADLQTKRKVTFNAVLQEDVGSKGLYEYFSPIWNSDQRQLFVLKKRIGDSAVRIMKISFGGQEATAKESVDRYIKALIVRDEDYAKSLMENPPEFLTYSNPYPVSYRILNSKVKGKSTFIEAEIYRTYTANAFYSITKYQFEMVKGGEGYMIHHAKELDYKEISTFDTVTGDDTGVVSLISSKGKRELFTLQDVKKQFPQKNPVRISSLAADSNYRTIIFSLQETENKSRANSVSLFKYDMEKDRVSSIAEVNNLNGQHGIGITSLAFAPSGKHFAVNLESGEKKFLMVYDIQKNKLIKTSPSSHMVFWKGNNLVFETYYGKQRKLNIFDPIKLKIGNL
ncbi:hypothetical protein CVD28_19500 [Bacillus sp. M6-12]|uniref:TolB family protein n=1 Tax=Bacillus sp. M6-12 TaxID=2054166 RepID=UPI000C778F91|nr:hypothetical protein [Bacillus sp. M6-12]PLS15930.1 hypothetical protein CVD28_19500 [Bacillus sp. M6-12]